MGSKGFKSCNLIRKLTRYLAPNKEQYLHDRLISMHPKKLENPNNFNRKQCPNPGEQRKLFRIASDECTDPLILSRLSESDSEIIRGAVALNSKTPECVVKKLLSDKSNYVRSALRKRGINVPDNLTICISGKNDIAVNGIKYVVSEFSEYDICFIPGTDRGINNWENSFKKAGEDLGLRQVSLEDVYDIEELLFISLEFSELVDTTRFRSKRLFNIHFSLLPKYKGMYTSALPILHGEDKSGVTLHEIDNGIDTGGIIDQIEFPINPEDTARDLYFKYLCNGFTLFKANLENLVNNNYSSIPQSACNSSYYSKKSIDYKNIKINFFKSAFEVKNQFRAFAFREYQMPLFENWHIYKSEITAERSVGKPGEKRYENEDHFVVSTVDYDIRLFKDYYSMLWECCEAGDGEELERAVGKVPDINLVNTKGWNAIIIATYNGHLSILERLIALGADINSRNGNGTTLLMYALSYFERTQDSRVFEFLARLGSSTSGEDVYGKSLKEYILEKKCAQLLKYIDLVCDPPL